MLSSMQIYAIFMQSVQKALEEKTVLPKKNLMPSLHRLTESMILDEAGNMVSVWYVDLRDPDCRTPITALIKGCRKQHAIEDLGTIRVSKPECFRKLEEGLIGDISEARASSQSVMSFEQTDDPEDIKKSQLFNNELEKCGKSIGEKIKIRTTSVKNTKKSRETKVLTFGKNGWIYSTSIEPTDELETIRWKDSLPNEYDHIDRIYRLREFARSLGLMVTEQLGPHGKEQSLKTSLDGKEVFHSTHKSQLIVHGPVIYLENPYELISSLSSNWEQVILPIFVKDIKYLDQREYRFVIWTEDEPSEKCVDLKVSKSMLGSLQPRPEQPVGTSPAARSTEENPKTEKELTEEQEKKVHGVDRQSGGFPPLMDKPYDSLLANLDNPLTPLVPHSYSPTDLPDDLNETITTYSVLKALRRKVEQTERKRRTKVASAAWHAEPCIRSLCSTFVDPIASLSINDDDILVIEIKFPEGVNAEAKIAFGPLGASTYTLKKAKEKRVSWSSPFKGSSVTNSVMRALSESGLLLRTQPTE